MIESLRGDTVLMRTAHDRHYGSVPRGSEPGNFMEIFAQAMNKTITSVNRDQVDADKLMIKMATEPESVDIHDVMIAQQKAQLSLDFTKNILQKTVQAYEKLTNLR